MNKVIWCLLKKEKRNQVMCAGIIFLLSWQRLKTSQYNVNHSWGMALHLDCLFSQASLWNWIVTTLIIVALNKKRQWRWCLLAVTNHSQINDKYMRQLLYVCQKRRHGYDVKKIRVGGVHSINRRARRFWELLWSVQK